MKKFSPVLGCEKLFSSIGLLQNHSFFHSDKKPFQCFSCNKAFKRPEAKRVCEKRHIAKNKEPSIEQRDKDKSIVIQKNPNVDKMKRKPTSQSKSKYHCLVCDKFLLDKYAFRRHVNNHSGEKSFGCTLCEKSFSDKGTWTRHQKVHTGEKLSSCPECEKPFRYEQDVKRHLRVHTGEHPFSCTECDKSFTDSGNLKRHRKVHQIGKLSCNLCDKHLRPVSMTSHMKTSHNKI